MKGVFDFLYSPVDNWSVSQIVECSIKWVIIFSSICWWWSIFLADKWWWYDVLYKGPSILFASLQLLVSLKDYWFLRSISKTSPSIFFTFLWMIASPFEIVTWLSSLLSNFWVVLRTIGRCRTVYHKCPWTNLNLFHFLRDCI